MYESEGRKYLEAGGLTFAKNSGQISTFSCSTTAPKEVWVSYDERANAQLSTRDSEGYDLMVRTKTGLFCFFKFSSAREMYENSDLAVQACLHQSPGECQGEFAFQ